MSSWGFDLALVARSLYRHPGFALAAVIPLALAMGANVTLYRVIEDVVLGPRTVLDSNGLYVVWETSERRDGLMSEISYPDFLEWRRSVTAFEDMAAMGSINWLHGWSEDGELVRNIPYRAVSWSFFNVLGVDAALGRTFVPSDDERDAQRVVVVSHAFWQSRLGGDPGVVGKTIRLGPRGDEPYTVIGVMPRELRFPRDAEMWTPLGRDLAGFGALERNIGVLFAVGRLPPDVSPERARTELSGIVRRRARDEHHRLHWAEWRAVLTPLVTFELGKTPLGLSVLGGAAGLLLVIGAMSVGGLVLARSITRRHELAVYTALGAGPGIGIRKTLFQSIVLVLAGTAGGVAMSLVATPLLLSRLAVASRSAYGFGWGLDDGLFVAAASGIALVLVATPGAVSVRPQRLRRYFGSHVSARATLQGWQKPLIVIATSIAVVLAAAAVLLVKSYVSLASADLGFRPDNVLSFQVSPPEGSSRPAQQLFYRELVERTESLDGVIRAAAVRNRPLLHGAVGDDWTFIYEGQSEADFDSNPTVNSIVVSPGYFEVMGIRLIAGRTFDEGDRETAMPVVVLGESLARYAWPSETAVGKRIWFGMRDDRGEPIWYTVVGVVADARYRGLTTWRLDLYHSFEQADPQPTGLVVRTRADPYAVVPAIREHVRVMDETLDVERVTTMNDAVATAMAPWRFNMWVSSSFASFGLGVAALGLFGIVAFGAAQRTREMGIRSAVGATPGDIWRLLTRESLSMVGVGVVVGTTAALVGAQLLSGLLYGVAAHDAGTFVAAASLLFVTGLAACHVPARRAARVSPVVSLRHE